MTADMAFEGLIVTRDAGVFGIFDRLLRQLSISTVVCVSASRACAQLTHATDLVIIDCDNEHWSDLLQAVWQSKVAKKPTIVAISAKDSPVSGAHVVLKKPVTVQAGEQSLKAAYQRMLHDYRQHARHALMLPVVATDDAQRKVPLTVTDIGPGGIGVSSKAPLPIGTLLRLRLKLSNTTREIVVDARVLWTTNYGRCGCEFVRIPPLDAMLLQDWLKNKVRIKKPLAEL